jgi:hypothetical protein
MKAAITISLVFLVLSSFGQQDSTEAKPLKIGYTEIERESRLINPLFIIKGDDIRRFPTLNFLEAVNGLFPWVFSFEPNANDFLYVVDGNILADINAISLYNIEEVAFIRGGLETGNYPFAKRGSFIIRTKSRSASSSFEFNANTGFQYLKSGRPFPLSNNPFYRYDSTRSKGVFQNYQLSYFGKAGKTNYYFSGNFAYDQTPPVSLQQIAVNGTTYFKYKTRSNLFRIHTGATIPLLPSLRLDLMGIAAFQKAKVYSTNSFTQGNYRTITNSDLPERYYTIYSSLNWTISKFFSNKLSYAYSDNKERLETGSIFTSDLPDVYTGSITDTTKVKRGYIENNTAYQSKDNHTWKIKTGLSLRYNFFNLRKAHLGMNFINNLLNSAEGSTFQGRTRFITAVPYITLAYRSLLSFYGGLQLFVKGIGKNGNPDIKSSSKRLPYGGAVFSLMNLFSQKKMLNRFDLGVNYSERNNNLTDYYRLERKETPDQVSPVSYYSFYAPNDFLKDKLFSLQATAGFLEDRFMIGTEWFKGKDGRFFALTIPTAPGSSVIYTSGNVNTKGIGVFGKAQLLQSRNYSWNLRVNAVKQERIKPYNFVQNEIYYPLTAGLQNNISMADFFVQLTVVMGFNKQSTSLVAGFPTSKKVDELSVSHMLLGYKLSLHKTWISDMQVFIQAKNIIASKNIDSYREWPRYIGIGFNLAF